MDDEGINEMEECASTTALEIEDPDSRDSGISLAPSIGSSCCSQGTLITAIDNVLEISGRRDVEKTQQNQTLARAETLSEDFLTELEDSFDGEQTFRLFCEAQSPMRKRQKRLVKQPPQPVPTDFSLLHQDLQSTSSSSTTNSSIWLKGTTNPHNNSDLPPAARSIHRVHSDSVLELSRDRSLGSPEVLESYSLLTVERPQVPHRAFRSIDANTLGSLLESMPEEQFTKRFVLIDCRYPYEFEGGHIWYSVNVWQPSSIIELFYPEDQQKFEEMNERIPIFYCEYSQKRGPNMALELRKHDRNRNASKYPFVDYKEIYLLDRGYRHFFKERQLTKFCSPPTYIQMWDPAFTDQRKGLEWHRKVKKRRRQ